MTETEFREKVEATIRARVAAAQPKPYTPKVSRDNRSYAVLAGEALDFWQPSKFRGYDNDQEVEIFAAVHCATSAPGASAADRWEIVEAEILELARKYAEARVEGIT